MKLARTRHLKTTVVLETIGNVDVSTIDLSQSTPFWTGFETCLFYGKDGHNSQVVETYSSWEEAIQGHAHWTNELVLARCLTGDVN